ncbi:MAG: hypothetical protein D6753_18635 [Planctomycetota bacterium]|nr:MAG: hypothetical protein D6753_18635 [Planctomycetota bacterium]
MSQPHNRSLPVPSGWNIICRRSSGQFASRRAGLTSGPIALLVLTLFLGTMPRGWTQQHTECAGELLTSVHGADTANGLVRAGDCVWEVSTRCIPESCHWDPRGIRVARLQGCRWTSDTFETMMSEITTPVSEEERKKGLVRTVIYIHGNWTEAASVRERGLRIYCRLKQMNAPPMRFLIYSWPSTRDRSERILRDIQHKSWRLDFEAFVVAHLLRQMPPDRPLGILGFSFGGAIAAGALHLDAGGRWGPYRLDGPAPERQVHVTLLAPAFDRDAFRPCGEFSQAIQQCGRIVNYYNSCDPVLKHFRLIDPQTRPEAAGFSGVIAARNSSSRGPIMEDPRIEQINCCCSIGRTHAELDYYHCLVRFPAGLYNLIDTSIE